MQVTATLVFAHLIKRERFAIPINLGFPTSILAIASRDLPKTSCKSLSALVYALYVKSDVSLCETSHWWEILESNQ